MVVSLGKLQEVVGDREAGLVCCSPWGQRVGHDWVTEQQWFVSIWTFESTAPSVIESLPLNQKEDAKHSRFTGKETESQGKFAQG